jgi:hypothetical protein
MLINDAINCNLAGYYQVYVLSKPKLFISVIRNSDF